MDKNIEKLYNERTLVLVKPDGVSKKIVGEIISRFERAGLTLIGLGITQASKEKIDGHYPKNPEWIHRLGEKTLATYEKYGIDAGEALGTTDPAAIGKMVREWLVDFMVQGPLGKVALRGPHVIDVVRKMAGHTLPFMADAGTIRGDFSTDSPVFANIEKRAVSNMVHASETPEEAEHEVAYWFSAEELINGSFLAEKNK